MTMPPVRAIAVGATIGLGGAVTWLAAEAFRRGQSWGWTVMTFVLAVQTVILFTSFSTPTRGFNLSLNGLLGFLLLLRLLANGATIRQWVRDSGALPRKLAVGVASVMVAATAGVFFGDRLPDPTQSGPGDVSVSASIECGYDPNIDPSRKMVTVALETVWRQVDPLPLGLARATDAWGDSVVLHLADSSWLVAGQILDDATGGEVGGGAAWAHPLPAAFAGLTPNGGIMASAMTAGRPVRLTFVAFGGTETVDYPAFVRIRYAHRDTFVLKTELACDGRGRLMTEDAFDAQPGHDLRTGLPLEP
jgi:hypothetical protein